MPCRTDTRGYGSPVTVRSTRDLWRVVTLTYRHTRVWWPWLRLQHTWPLTCWHADLPTHEGMVAKLPSAAHVTSDVLSRWLTDTRGYGGPDSVCSTCDLWRVTLTYRHTRVWWPSYCSQHTWPLKRCHADLPTHEGMVAHLPSAAHVTSYVLTRWLTDTRGYGCPVPVRSTRDLWLIVTLTRYSIPTVCRCRSPYRWNWRPSPYALNPGHLEDFHMLLKRKQNNNASIKHLNYLRTLLNSHLILTLCNRLHMHLILKRLSMRQQDASDTVSMYCHIRVEHWKHFLCCSEPEEQF